MATPPRFLTAFAPPDKTVQLQLSDALRNPNMVKSSAIISCGAGAALFSLWMLHPSWTRLLLLSYIIVFQLLSSQDAWTLQHFLHGTETVQALVRLPATIHLHELSPAASDLMQMGPTFNQQFLACAKQPFQQKPTHPSQCCTFHPTAPKHLPHTSTLAESSAVVPHRRTEKIEILFAPQHIQLRHQLNYNPSCRCVYENSCYNSRGHCSCQRNPRLPHHGRSHNKPLTSSTDDLPLQCASCDGLREG